MRNMFLALIALCAIVAGSSSSADAMTCRGPNGVVYRAQHCGQHGYGYRHRVYNRTPYYNNGGYNGAYNNGYYNGGGYAAGGYAVRRTVQSSGYGYGGYAGGGGCGGGATCGGILPSPYEIASRVPHQISKVCVPCPGYDQDPVSCQCSRTTWVPGTTIHTK